MRTYITCLAYATYITYITCVTYITHYVHYLIAYLLAYLLAFLLAYLLAYIHCAQRQNTHTTTLRFIAVRHITSHYSTLLRYSNYIATSQHCASHHIHDTAGHHMSSVFGVAWALLIFNLPLRRRRLPETEPPTPPTRQRGAQRAFYARLWRGSLRSRSDGSTVEGREEDELEVGCGKLKWRDGVKWRVPERACGQIVDEMRCHAANSWSKAATHSLRQTATHKRSHTHTCLA